MGELIKMYLRRTRLSSHPGVRARWVLTGRVIFTEMTLRRMGSDYGYGHPGCSGVISLSSGLDGGGYLGGAFRSLLYVL